MSDQTGPVGTAERTDSIAHSTPGPELPEVVMVGDVATRLDEKDPEPDRAHFPRMWHGRSADGRFYVFLHAPWPDSSPLSRMSRFRGSVSTCVGPLRDHAIVIEADKPSLDELAVELARRIAGARVAFGPLPRRRRS